ncbi:MAG: DNA translocase FtsK [Candidatus Wildermuthbacteria bacterium]|nr:DNA translocase FtsK [Candidatus Wildermuthbacteria bacterium]
MKKNNKVNKNNGKERKQFSFGLQERTKRQIGGVAIWLAAIVISLSFFHQAGVAGNAILKTFKFLFGRTAFILPVVLFLGGLVFFITPYKKFLWGVILGSLFLVFGSSAIFESLKPGLKYGGYLGYIESPIFNLFGFWVTQIVFGGMVAVGGLIFWHLLRRPVSERWNSASTEEPIVVKRPFVFQAEAEKSPSLIQKIFLPKFRVKELESDPSTNSGSPRVGSRGENRNLDKAQETQLTKESLLKGQAGSKYPYKIPPLDLLDPERGSPLAGDIRVNSAIIKKTLENFDIPVEMSEVNIGPTVTQYTLKPADGVKLSKITTLSNDLAMSLANHPIRIEAPIPGKSLVGIEVPNKIRTQVKLRDLLSSPQFQNSFYNLGICLGRDVSGIPFYADLTRMPHLLVAGATGTGKTIFLNNLIVSFLYRNSPETMRLILVDPKRVEFPVFNDLPHLLCPVILDSQKTVNALRWLVQEMERRFGILSAEKTRDIKGYNESVSRKGEPILPYIVVVIDELADLMASKGREVEAGIVRLAQMARAVGIHLIVATQRPSVEVITGLIKANITSRVTFQVASQIDSRTVIDAAGAEKLLGQGDLLFISAEVAKPKRLQGAYISEKEVKKVVNFIKTENAELETEKIEEGVLENHMARDLEKALDAPETDFDGFYTGGDDPLYEEAKRLVVESRKASASLLQRRLRVGYARAARLIDLLEEKGIVGEAQGAKARAVFLEAPKGILETDTDVSAEVEAEKDEWNKV